MAEAQAGLLAVLSGLLTLCSAGPKVFDAIPTRPGVYLYWIPVGAGTGLVRGYEIRRWRSGVIPDLGFAVLRPVHVGEGEALARTVLDLVPLVPTPGWGRDELRAGQGVDSNSVTAWLLVSVGLDAAAGRPPKGGRAPGWDAGVAVARLRSPIRPHETAA